MDVVVSSAVDEEVLYREERLYKHQEDDQNEVKTI